MTHGIFCRSIIYVALMVINEEQMRTTSMLIYDLIRKRNNFVSSFQRQMDDHGVATVDSAEMSIFNADNKSATNEC